MAQRIRVGELLHEAAWLTDTAAGQRVLADAKASGIRLTCACQSGGVRMYTGQRKSVLYIARMPGTGLLHSTDCASYEPANMLSGGDCYEADVIEEDGMGATIVKLGDPASGELPLRVMGVDGVLDLLLERAGLNHCDGTTAERDWETASGAIRTAARMILVDQEGVLGDRLIVPRRYDAKAYAGELAAQQAIIASYPETWILTTIKEVTLKQGGILIHLRQMPGHLIWVGSRMASQCPLSVADNGTRTEQVLLLARVVPGRRKGVLLAKRLALRLVDNRFMPCSDSMQSWMANKLIGEGRRLFRPLRFDAGTERVLADYAIMDTGGPPHPLFILSNGSASEYDTEKRAFAEMLARHGAPVSLWDARKKGRLSIPPRPQQTMTS